ncbi:uncharacterized protein LOC123902041 [Trifolium pratense]|uniref:Uncharacterized protein n=1 Tax=Trifolium pratense TaxID=57577 RepID=A0ACB0M1Q8_TRIPR|nr:uncharacterized protein LOC123902041 [Trifolium pratense]CAJ2675754.1 unnamed protein product [Trifolium pratense]
MHNTQRGQTLEHSFVILQVREEQEQAQQPKISSSNFKLNFSTMKLINRFRKVLMRFVFPSNSSHHRSSADSSRHRNSSERFEPPKTSCSSYYSSYSHYNEAISDCIEFFNKEGVLDGRKSSDVNV